MRKMYLTSSLLVLCFIFSACAKSPIQVKESGGNIEKMPMLELTLIEWVETGLTLECRVDAPENVITLRVKDSKARIDGIAYPFDEQINELNYRGVYLIDNSNIYIWKGGNGVKMSHSVYNGLENQDINEDETNTALRKIIKIWETGGFDYVCKEVNLADDFFQPDPEVKYKEIKEDSLLSEEEDVADGSFQ